MGNVSLKVLEFFCSKKGTNDESGSTRFSNFSFQCSIVKKNTEGSPTFNVRTIRDWNELSADVKKSKTVKSFENKLYTNLVTR